MCLWICFLFVFVLIIVGHPHEVSLKVLWRSDLIWLRYLGSKNIYLFVCLFVCLWICLFFCFNHHGTPTGSFPESFMMMQHVLNDIFRIQKCLFACLFVCLMICGFIVLIILGHPQEVILKILWRFDWIWLKYLGYKNVDYFVYLFISLWICLFILF